MEPTLESKLALEPKLDLSHIPKSILVPEHFTKPKSIIPPSHILLLDQGIDHNDSEMIFKDWSYNWDNFNVRILHDPIQFGDDKYVNREVVIKGGFIENPRYLYWAAMLDPI